MVLSLIVPPPTYTDRRPSRHRRSSSRCWRVKFEPTIAPSRATGEAYSDSKLRIRDVLCQLGLEWSCEDVSIRIIAAGRKNGRLGWKVFDFRVGAVLIEVSMDPNPAELSEIEFIKDRYGLSVVHLTADLVETVANDPDVLARLIDQAQKFQATSAAHKFHADILEAGRQTAVWRQERLNKRRRRAESTRKRDRRFRATTAPATASSLDVIATFSMSNALA